MKKKIGIILSAGLIAVVLGFGIFQSDASQQASALTTEEVSQLVLAQYPGEITDIELTKSQQGLVYEIEVQSNDKSYHLSLDGNSGEVLSLKEKAILNQENPKEDSIVNKAETEKKSQNKTQSDSAQDKEKQPIKEEPKQDKETPKVSIKEKHEKQPQGTEKNKNKKPAKDTSKSQKNTAIDISSAIDVAQAEFPGVIVEVDLDENDERLIYEIEVYNGKEAAEIEIDALTGKIVVLDIDYEDYDFLRGQLNKVKDLKSVIDIAQKQFAGTVVEIDLDEEDGRLIYEIEVGRGNQEAEIEIDAITGEVLDVDIDD